MLHITFSKYDCIIVHKAYYLFTCTCVSINSFHSHSHTWSCSVTSNRQLGHHEVSTVVSSLHHPGCCIQECRGDPEYC